MTAMTIVEPAPAKINLALHVRRRRADGYHDLETLFAFAVDGDVVTIAKADRASFRITGPFAGQLAVDTGDNLVERAAAAFGDALGIDAAHAIILEKNLPIASGIGGGSADAAATLRALARLHGVEPQDDRLFAIAAGLGADVPACLLGRTALGTGKGDALAPLDGLAGTPLLLVNPLVPVSTARVFAGWDGLDRGGLLESDLRAQVKAGRNDLERSAIGIAPVIADVRTSLDSAPGMLVARMSGSGATCFALFADVAARDAAARGARAKGWWTLASVLA